MSKDSDSQFFSGGSQQRLSLSRSQIAFLTAVIEFLREEESGRIESVTIALDDTSEPSLVGCEPTLMVCDRKYVIQAFGYFMNQIFPEQPDFAERLRSHMQRNFSLDELVDLRNRLEDRPRQR